MRRVRRDRLVVGAPAPLRGVRPRRLLRRLLNTHATRHWEETGHAVIQSYEPGETWAWDYRDDTRSEGLELAAPTSHPVTQAVPGPADRLPGDWLELLGGSR